jgi:tripartite-type tricarboxylate transporter receptor subunit TctC
MKSIFSKAMLGVFGIAALSTTQVAMAADSVVPQNLRIVIGSNATSGDTYQNAAIFAEALAQKLGVNAKVDPVGPSAGFKAIARADDGNTIMLFHDQSYLSYLYKVRGFDDMFEEFTVGPTLSINPGDAFLVPAKSPYKTIDDVIAAAGKGTKVRVAIQPGGVSAIGYSGLKNAVKEMFPGKESNIVAVNTGSQSDKNQLLFDGNADLINGSIQGNEQYTRLPADDQKAMRFVWVTARSSTLAQANPEGMGGTTRDQLLKFAEPNVKVPKDSKSLFAFDKEFFLLYSKHVKPEFVAAIDKALTDIMAEGKIQGTLKKSFFIPNFKPSKDAQPYLKQKFDTTKRLIENITD